MIDPDKSWMDLLRAIKEEEWEEAISSIDNLIRREPSDPEHFVRLGDMYIQGNDNARAASAYKKAMDMFKKRQDTAKAIVVCSKLLALEPDNKKISKDLDMLLAEHKNSILEVATAPEGFSGAGTSSLSDKLSSFIESPSVHELLRLLLKSASFNAMADKNVVFFKDGDRIISEGEAGDSIFIIISGGVEVSVSAKGRKVPLAILIDGDIFGEMSFITGKPRTATINAVTDVELVELKRPALDRLVEQSPHLLRYLYDVYISRMGLTLAELKKASDTGISGSLKDLGLADIFQVIDQTKKEGELTVKTDSLSGVISFSPGILEDAVSETMRGEDLIAELLLIKDGSFYFETGKTKKGRISRPVVYMLMECIRLIDERNRLSKYVPDETRRVLLKRRPAQCDDDMKTVMKTIASGPMTCREISRASRLSRIRTSLALAKLARECCVAVEKVGSG